MALPSQPALTATQLRHLAPCLSPHASKALKHRTLDRDDIKSNTRQGTLDREACYSIVKQNRIAQLNLNTRVNHVNRQRKATRTSRHRLALDDEDGIALARSSCPLPSDGCHAAVKPNLQRQEAFRAANKTLLRFSDVVMHDCDLYRLGILYDDEHARGSGFGLHALAVIRTEPVYVVCSSKRLRRSRNSQPSIGKDESLPLDLSFISFGSDAYIARYLVSEHADTFTKSLEYDEPVSALRVSRPSTPLHINYELLLDQDSLHSLHSLPTPAPTATDFPDLMFDSEGEEEEYDDSNSWAVMPRSQRGTPDIDVDVVRTQEDENGAMSAAEAWIVLGET
ncbi:uncharacterized protein BCR38DRAFT_227095 [Pseudomassariella vexata]|uniref:Uncharacterized protein n=1 Tax=Pseudomassariella vexata TaxID=1141098 RepID=A0A1Y2DVZ8_9PEZI|nr:uncharacterized protein BCR38DRAFT_227095 [Pseudomassariella vexata]ORY63359.1 hypothetical protein BCR38DRAFT_227095 [Pseudomassariella vexata]